jgi:hypothetical protein
MSYATVTKSNLTYQPRENIKTLLDANLTNISIYSMFPNVKAMNFKGFPLIVIPDFSLDNERYLGDRSIDFMNEVEGTIYHDREKMGDNQLRNAKQKIVETLLSRTNQKLLRGYGMDNVNITFDSSPQDPVIEHEKELLPVSFTISFNLDVIM